MATNQLIEDNNNSTTRYYYVDQYGAMVKNTWKAVAKDGDDDLDAEYWWYYFGSDGKAYTTDKDKLTSSTIKTIDGKKYAFDSEGHMLYGWIKEDDLSQQDDVEEAWKDATYFFNGWNDGHMQTGWLQMTVEDDNETKTYWFNFKNDGKKRTKRAKINNAYYYFDVDDGHMLTDWAVSTAKQASDDYKTASPSGYTYLNGDGSERRNTWVWAVADEDASEEALQQDYENDDYRWWYFKSNGKLASDELKKINGKTYAFDEYGRMQFAFVSATNKHNVTNLGKGSDWSREQWIANACDDYSTPAITNSNDATGIYYFSSSEEKDGSMKKGYQTIELDDGSYQFYFNTTSGKAENGWVKKIKKYAHKGLVLQPTSDDDSNYGAVVTSNNSIVFNENTIGHILVNNSGSKVTKKTKLKDNNGSYYVVNGSGTVVAFFEDEDEYNKFLEYTDNKGNTKHTTIDNDMVKGNNVTFSELQTAIQKKVAKTAGNTYTGEAGKYNQ